MTDANQPLTHLDDWEESKKRSRAWLSPADAAALIDEPELATLVRSLSNSAVMAEAVAA